MKNKIENKIPVKNKEFVSEKIILEKEKRSQSLIRHRGSRSWVFPAAVKSENDPLVLLKYACHMLCEKLRTWEECLYNLKFIYEKMPLKISPFLKMIILLII